MLTSQGVSETLKRASETEVGRLENKENGGPTHEWAEDLQKVS